MPTWKKVIVSGSNAELNTVSASGYLSTAAANNVGFVGTASWAQSSSVALTASFAQNVTAPVFSITGSVGSASFSANGDILSLTGTNGLAVTVTDSGATTSASFGIPTNAQVTFGGVTSSVFGTSSWAQSASNAVNSQTASFLPAGTYQITASWAQSASNALTSSFLPVGTYNITASWAQSASNAVAAQTASFLTAGTYQITASWAQSASNAVTASYIAAPTLANNLTQGTGITTFTYNGSSAQNVSVSGASSLNTNIHPKWTGTAFANSLITDDGNTVTIGGNLTVNGTTVTVSTENLTVSDKFILLASGSTTNVDGGIIISNAAGNTGSAFYWDGNDQRWAVNTGVGALATSVAANSYVVTVSGSSGNPSGNPFYGAANGSRIGAMYVDNSLTGNNDNNIWIWA